MKDGKFEVGDEVVCVNAVGSIIKGKKYVVYKSFTHDGDGMEKISLEGVYQLYYADRFKLVEPKFVPEYFSALNEKDAEKYIGKVMEFADTNNIRGTGQWRQEKFTQFVAGTTSYCFQSNKTWYQFMRTCPETFQKKKVKKLFESWVNIYTGDSHCFFSCKEDADLYVCSDKVACLHLTKEYEVEE